jgi:hypothetical protein
MPLQFTEPNNTKIYVLIRCSLPQSLFRWPGNMHGLLQKGAVGSAFTPISLFPFLLPRHGSDKTHTATEAEARESTRTKGTEEGVHSIYADCARNVVASVKRSSIRALAVPAPCMWILHGTAPCRSAGASSTVRLEIIEWRGAGGVGLRMQQQHKDAGGPVRPYDPNENLTHWTQGRTAPHNSHLVWTPLRRRADGRRPTESRLSSSYTEQRPPASSVDRHSLIRLGRCRWGRIRAWHGAGRRQQYGRCACAP